MRAGEGVSPVHPAVVLVRNGLYSAATLDFPLVTEICERLENEPSEIPTSVRALIVAMNHTNPRVQLRALTITHELMYSAQAIKAFRRDSEFRESIRRLRATRGTDLGAVSDENMRMLATEIERACFSERRPSNQTSGTASAPASSIFSGGLTGHVIPSNPVSQHSSGHQDGSVSSSFTGFWKRTQKALATTKQNAEKAFERTMTTMMGEVEKGWDGLLSPEGGGGSSSSSAALGPSGHGVHGKKVHDKETLSAMEDEQLQWAIKDSLRESRRREKAEEAGRRGGPGFVPPPPPPQSHPGGSGRPASEAQRQSLFDLEAFLDVKTSELGVVKERIAAASAKDNALQKSLQERQQIAQRLAAALRAAEQKREELIFKESELESKLSSMKGGPGMVQVLQQRVHELEQRLIEVKERAEAASRSPAPEGPSTLAQSKPVQGYIVSSPGATVSSEGVASPVRPGGLANSVVVQGIVVPSSGDHPSPPPAPASEDLLPDLASFDPAPAPPASTTARFQEPPTLLD